MTNRVEELTKPFFEKRDHASMTAALDGLDRKGLSSDELAAWFEIRGAAAFQLGRRDEARRVYEEGLAAFPKNGNLRFGLGQEREGVGDIDGAIALWRGLDYQSVTGAHLGVIARYLYLWDRFVEARQALRPTFDAYDKLRIVDDTFLYLRRVPMYSVTYGAFAAIALVEGRPELARKQLDHDAKRLHDYDFDAVRRELDAHLTADWSAVLAADQKWLDDPRMSALRGMPFVRSAAVRSRAAPDRAGALAEIDAVTIGPNDHAWLNDVLLLLRAEALHRFGDAREEQAVGAFLGRQSMLFEPEHGFYFGFLRYQETLKSRYRATRGR
jgi:tetratricopeptide (TPR) repeat protein